MPYRTKQPETYRIADHDFQYMDGDWLCIHCLFPYRIYAADDFIKMLTCNIIAEISTNGLRIEIDLPPLNLEIDLPELPKNKQDITT